jgi:hypothetical protein
VVLVEDHTHMHQFLNRQATELVLKVKVSLYLINHRAMKSPEGVEVYLHTLLHHYFKLEAEDSGHVNDVVKS